MGLEVDWLLTLVFNADWPTAGLASLCSISDSFPEDLKSSACVFNDVICFSKF